VLGLAGIVAIMRAANNRLPGYTMSDNTGSKHAGDGAADAFAVTAIITIIVVAMTVWLSGMPS
jgi:hypothetical protein